METNSLHICSICLDDFTRPRLLPCCHTFCENCLDDYIRRHAHLNKFNCPNCRKVTEVPKDGAKGFPINFYIEEKGKKHYCPKHHDMELRFYCRDCNTPICHDCAVVGHENHRKADMKDVDHETRATLCSHKHQLEDKIKVIKDLKDCLGTQIKDITEAANRACAEVDRQVENICSSVKAQGKSTKDKIKKRKDEDIKERENILIELGTVQKKIQTDVCNADDVLKEKATVPILNMVPKYEALVQNEAPGNTVLPNTRYQYLPPLVLEMEGLKQQLENLKMMDTPTFTVAFDMVKLEGCNKSLDSSDIMIQGLPWRVRVKHVRDAASLSVFLKLRKTHCRTQEYGILQGPLQCSTGKCQ